jgi:DMSO/TMAO reductase YedYZ heme-binding membrane subunit
VKFNPTWQQVALLAVLLAAICVTHLWVPGAISAITSIVSTIVGALFVNLQPRAEGAMAPVLALVQPQPPSTGGQVKGFTPPESGK